MAENLRDYNCKDVEVLHVGSTICTHGINYNALILPARPQWTVPYFTALNTEIEDVYLSALGIDNAAAMRQATQALYELMKPASEALLMFKVQLTVDFDANKPRKNEILNLLGYTQHYKRVQKKDQEAFVELLTKFEVNMTPALRTELNTAGIDDLIIDKVLNYSTSLRDANITQEVAKGFRKDISSDAVVEINNIYKKIIAISKVTALIFKNDKAKKDAFNFSKNLRQLNYQNNNVPPPTP
ncbi:MAG: hypothetical protein IPM47_13665 [Sphingobacteriales bacterium]|nr:MAG: hypothetical protein IPM47_13665 [Sphingobacteriales bacterium]